MRRILLFAPLLLAVFGPETALSQRDGDRHGQSSGHRAVTFQRSNIREVRYTLTTNTVQNVPLTAGRTYRLVIDGLNPICYTYVGTVTVKRENPNLSAFVTPLGTLPGAAAPKASETPTTPKSVRNAIVAFDQGGREVVAPRVTLTRNGAVLAARGKARQAQEIISAVRQSVASVDAVVKEVTSPSCTVNTSFSALREQWNAAVAKRAGLESGSQQIRRARELLDEARAFVVSVPAGDENDAITNLISTTEGAADDAQEAVDSTVAEMILAEGLIRAAEENHEFITDVYLPADADSVNVAVKVTQLHPASGKDPVSVEQKTSIAVRHGMRMFLSVGGLASALNSHDFQRVNRPCATSGAPPCDSAASTYSTYADQTRNRGFAFSPVLQANVAFRDVLSSGVSLHTSLGVAARSVNGSVSPEFILGVGTGFVDRFLLTAGLHYARDEKLLIGRPGDVERTAVPTTITDADAISTVWRPALGFTVTVRLPGN